MQDHIQLERSLLTSFVDALRALPDVNASSPEIWSPPGPFHEHEVFTRVDLKVAGKPLVLRLETKNAVYPRDVREMIWKVQASRHGQPAGKGTPLPVLLAESISPGAKELLRNERIGYFDSGGSLFLPAPGAYIFIDKPAPKPFVKSIRNLFAGRRAQVLHVLLVRCVDWFGVHELAQEALVSPATASQVLTELEHFDWMELRGQGPSKERRLREPAALLNEWVQQLENTRPPALRRYYIPNTKADLLAAKIGQVCEVHNVLYAITHEAAAQRYAPFLSSISQVRARVLMSSSADAALGDLAAREVNEGANFVVIEAKSPGEMLFRERMDDLWLASRIQIYLDLVRGEGRSKEMAAHFRTAKIGF